MPFPVPAAWAAISQEVNRLPETMNRASDEYQPIETRYELADGVVVVSNLFVKAGAYLPQHAHEYAHSSFVAAGRVKMWQDGNFLGEFIKNEFIVIPAHSKHVHQAQEDGTVVLCIHRFDRTGEIDIAEEHQIV